MRKQRGPKGLGCRFSRASFRAAKHDFISMNFLIWIVLSGLILGACSKSIGSSIVIINAHDIASKEVQSSTVENCSNFFDELWLCSVEFWTEATQQAFSVLAKENIVEDGPVWAAAANLETMCRKEMPWHLNFISNGLVNEGIHLFDVPQLPTRVYVIDSYIDNFHNELKHAIIAKSPSFINGSSKNGHGTHIAGIIAGNTYGVNKEAKIVGVQVLDDTGHGSWNTIIRGLEWISKQPIKGIISMSITGMKNKAVDSAIDLMVKHGFKFVVAAGNDAKDACQYSPANIANVITVGALNPEGKKSEFSNHGKCVDVYAPGSAILSTYPGNLFAYMQGTSMATPIVAALWSLSPYSSLRSFINDNTRLINKIKTISARAMLQVQTCSAKA